VFVLIGVYIGALMPPDVFNKFVTSKGETREIDQVE